MQETMEKKNKRAFPRNPSQAAVTCRQFTSSGAPRISDGVLHNFSNEGSYIETSHEYKSGTILIVRMVSYPTIPQSMAAAEQPRSICLAEVRWQQEMVGENTVQYGFGLRYLD